MNTLEEMMVTVCDEDNCNVPIALEQFTHNGIRYEQFGVCDDCDKVLCPKHSILYHEIRDINDVVIARSEEVCLSCNKL